MPNQNHHKFITFASENGKKSARELSPHYEMFSIAWKYEIHDSNTYTNIIKIQNRNQKQRHIYVYIS